VEVGGGGSGKFYLDVLFVCSCGQSWHAGVCLCACVCCKANVHR